MTAGESVMLQVTPWRMMKVITSEGAGVGQISAQDKVFVRTSAAACKMSSAAQQCRTVFQAITDWKNTSVGGKDV